LKYTTYKMRDGRYSADIPWRKRDHSNPVTGLGENPEDAVFNLLTNIRRKRDNG